MPQIRVSGGPDWALIIARMGPILVGMAIGAAQLAIDIAVHGGRGVLYSKVTYGIEK